MVTKEKLFLGIDLGGTNLKIGVVTKSGRILEQKTSSIKHDKTIAGVVKNITAEVESLYRKYPSVSAVGLGVPGIYDVEKDVLFSAPNLPDWKNVRVKKILSKKIKLPIVVDNDANMHAIGEHFFGAGKNINNFVLLTLGTGIGGGLILNGEIFHGDHGFAGEVGHLVVEPNGERCGCGGKGCWERYAASHGIKLHLKNLSKVEEKNIVGMANRNLSEITPRMLGDLASIKNTEALKVWGVFGNYLGIGIATLINVLGVENFVIGGGISYAWDFFINSTRENALSHTYKFYKTRLKLKRASLGNNAGILGAAACVCVLNPRKHPCGV